MADTSTHRRRTLHLHEKLGLHASRRLGLGVAALAAERVDLVDEDDAWLSRSSHLEQTSDALLALAKPLGEEIGRADGDEGALAFGGDGLGEVRFAGTGWLR